MRTESIDTVAKLIDAFGGTSAFARAIAIKPSTAGEMKRVQSIRPRYWPAIIAAARARGIADITAETMLQIASGASEAACG